MISNWKYFACIFGLLLAWTGAAALADRMAELQESFRQRHPQLQQLKQQGVIGETFEGYVEAVEQADEQQQQVIDAENNERRELYDLIAEQEGTAADHVARRNAQRNFERARPGEYLRNQQGEWSRKGEEEGG